MSNRSGTNYSAPTDADRRAVMLGVSTADGITPKPLEVDPATGLLQVTGAGTQYTDGTVSPAHPIGTAIVFSNNTDMVAAGNSWPLPVDLTNGGWPSTPLNVLINIGNPTNIGTLQLNATANGNGNSTGSTQSDISTIVLQVVSSPSMSGGTTVNFEASTDGTTWFPIEGHKVGTIGSLQTTTTSDGIFVFDYAGLVGALGGSTGIRARISSYSAGTITVHAYGSVYPYNKNTVALATGSNTIGAVTQSGTWSVTANAGTGTFNIQSNASVNNAQVAGSTTATSGTGIQKVGVVGNAGAAFDAATNAAPPANAIQTAGVSATALPSAYTATDLSPQMHDKFGRQVVLIGAMRDLVNPITQLTLTSTTTETTLIGAVASTFNDIVSLVVINTSATATQVDFRDSTAGTVRLSLYVPAGDTRGIALPTPLPQNTVNNNWTAKCGTSVASVIITGTYIANK